MLKMKEKLYVKLRHQVAVSTYALQVMSTLYIYFPVLYFYIHIHVKNCPKIYMRLSYIKKEKKSFYEKLKERKKLHSSQS